MKFIKSVLATVALTTAFMASAQANVATIGSSFDDTIYVAKSTGFFEKAYDFVLSSTGNITYSVSEVETLPLFNINFLNFGLYDSNLNLLSSSSNLASGTYTLLVSGKSVGTAGGLFNLKYNVAAVTAVPEPETNALMLVGLGLIGFIARRKFA